MAVRRKRPHEEPEHENHERWLITYSDMITLLMVLFIVLFSIGQTDLAKFKKLKEGLSQSLGGTKAVLDGGQGITDAGSAPNAGLTAVASLSNPAAAEQALKEKQAVQKAIAGEQQTLIRAEGQILDQLRSHGLENAVQFHLETRGLIVTVVSDRVLFDLGSDVLRPEGQVVLDGMAPALAGLPNLITIEGHTDDRPIVGGGAFATNWELSTARATRVLRYLVEAQGLPASRLSAAGYADQRPVVPNDTEEHRSQNRRVEIVIVSEYGSPSAKAGGT